MENILSANKHFFLKWGIFASVIIRDVLSVLVPKSAWTNGCASKPGMKQKPESRNNFKKYISLIIWRALVQKWHAVYHFWIFYTAKIKNGENCNLWMLSRSACAQILSCIHFFFEMIWLFATNPFSDFDSFPFILNLFIYICLVQ